jgi:hypothetical protein
MVYYGHIIETIELELDALDGRELLFLGAKSTGRELAVLGPLDHPRQEFYGMVEVETHVRSARCGGGAECLRAGVLEL